MAGHSQSRLSSPKETCPKCGKKGVGKETAHYSPTTGLVYLKECRYCRAIGRLRVPFGDKPIGNFVWDAL
jgi:hypothetical protein